MFSFFSWSSSDRNEATKTDRTRATIDGKQAGGELGDIITDVALEVGAVKSGGSRCSRANKCAQEAEVIMVC